MMVWFTADQNQCHQGMSTHHRHNHSPQRFLRWYPIHLKRLHWHLRNRRLTFIPFISTSTSFSARGKQTSTTAGKAMHHFDIPIAQMKWACLSSAKVCIRCLGPLKTASFGKSVCEFHPSWQLFIVNSVSSSILSKQKASRPNMNVVSSGRSRFHSISEITLSMRTQ